MRLLRRETDLKKVISAFIAAAIFVCTPVMSFVASASSNYVDTIEFLNALNITDKSEKNINDKVSRGEFLEMVIKALDLGKTSQSEKFFEDVDGSSPFYDVVSEAVNMGIISGDGNGKFLPDGNLSFRIIHTTTKTATKAPSNSNSVYHGADCMAYKFG